MRNFCWIAAGAIPAALDLRRLGWRLRPALPQPGQDNPCPILALPHDLPFHRWLALTRGRLAPRPLTLVLGIDDPLERARLLRLGFGEALGWALSLEELEVRAEQVLERAQALNRRRRAGALTLDLVMREGFVADRPLRLFPREFALLWRLSEVPGFGVAQDVLLRDVWGLSFRPETNSLAVHVSRLRAKLRLAGMEGLVETLADGGYRLAVTVMPRDFTLDGTTRLGKERLRQDI
ncbi:DNA-binding response OmpR family regulator [Novosphingobium kunmingense]|uniref:DNA-binding response OmpR family regulator n=1 Tax=Novosphingobium kunmingense TaxID=1211806 RepID=A0A2N0H737_9SPHN|nr:winged helix-turn-helix domain-containing protein [Novosphingobium kunmingense]PKB14751.1 DNA-binding response OmpR family regulator [Novosphingobium kunmingense]